jgi:hypothetical protein
MRQMSHQLATEAGTVKKQNEDMKVMRERAGEMREEIHNLRIEIDARPTMAQWKSKVLRELNQPSNQATKQPNNQQQYPLQICVNLVIVSASRCVSLWCVVCC